MKMTIKLSTFNTRLGSRQQGAELMEKIDVGANEFVFDFEGVRVMTCNFSDEVFGRLYANMGWREFSHRVHIRNAPTEFKLIIKKTLLDRRAHYERRKRQQRGA